MMRGAQLLLQLLLLHLRSMRDGQLDWLVALRLPSHALNDRSTSEIDNTYIRAALCCDMFKAICIKMTITQSSQSSLV